MKRIILYISQVETDKEQQLSAENRALVDTAADLSERISGHVTVMMYGYREQMYLLREALARGCDEALLLEKSRGAEGEYTSVSHLAAEKMRELGFDLILTGYRTLDGGSSYLGPQAAEYLKLPQISFADAVVKLDDKIRVERTLRDTVQTIESDLPCLLTMANKSTDGKTLSISNIIKACDKEIQVCRPEQGETIFEGGSRKSPYLKVETLPAKREKKQCILYHTIEAEDGEGGMLCQVISPKEAAGQISAFLKERRILA